LVPRRLGQLPRPRRRGPGQGSEDRPHHRRAERKGGGGPGPRKGPVGERVFWSKIWFFLVAVAAVLGLGVALTMPRPAERKALDAEDVRLAQAIESVRLVMVQDARKRADIALLYARHEIYKELKKIKEDAESAEAIGQQLHDSAKSTLDAMLASTAGAKP